MDPCKQRLKLGTFANRVVVLMVSSCALLMSGCGTTKVYTATEQLLMSDAVDSTIAKMDFTPLGGMKIYLDTTYISAAGKAPNTFINSDYVISALRQQMTAAGCMLVDGRDLADIICEARCGALGIDGHSVIYGMPANNAFSNAASVVAGTPTLPTIPEISIAKREMSSAAAKVAVFAYERETREPIWQSGVAQAGSSARDTWVLGIGPIQNGSIYGGTKFAGKRLLRKTSGNQEIMVAEGGQNINHRERHVFNGPAHETPYMQSQAELAQTHGVETVPHDPNSASPSEAMQTANQPGPGGEIPIVR